MKADWKTCFRVGAAAFLLFLCIHYWDAVAGILSLVLAALIPLLLGCVIAYVINILMSLYERRYFPSSQSKAVIKSRRPVCLLLSFLTLVVIAMLLLRLVVPELAACVQMLAAEVPAALERLAVLVTSSGLFSEGTSQALNGIDWESILARITSVFFSGVTGAVTTAAQVLSSVASAVVNSVVGLVFAIYLLAGKEKLQSQCSRLLARYLRPRWNDKVRYVLSVLGDCFHRYVVGQCTEAVILGALCAAGMVLLRFPYAGMTGVVVGFTALIPVAGAYIGGAVGFLLILTESPVKALMFLIYLVVLQQVEGNLIYPRVVGTSLGLPGIWVLAAVIVGGGVFGIVGMMLSVPIAAALYRLLREDVRKGLPAAQPKEEPKTEE